MMNIPDDLGSEIPLNGHQLRSGNRVTKQQLVLFDGFSVFFLLKGNMTWAEKGQKFTIRLLYLSSGVCNIYQFCNYW